MPGRYTQFEGRLVRIRGFDALPGGWPLCNRFGLGIIPGFGATIRLARFVGLPMAKELIFSGRRIKADEAKTIGLANHVYPAEGFLDKVIELARTIASQSFPAVARAKQLMNEFGESTGPKQ